MTSRWPGRRPRSPSWGLTQLLQSAFSRRVELVEEYKRQFANPWIAAERGYVDDVIDPAETRLKMIAGLRMLASKHEDLPRRKHGNVPL